MPTPVFWIPPGDAALEKAAGELAPHLAVHSAYHPDVTHLLLPVPSRDSAGALRCSPDVPEILARYPEIRVVGGNLTHPGLEHHHTIDLLAREDYLAGNAAITAHCALAMAMAHLPVTLPDCPTAILGWGRIGKCLAPLVRSLGAPVSVYARGEKDRAILRALGYPPADPDHLQARLVINTVPHPITQAQPGSLCLDLASQPGILGADVIHARGLPGKYAPESSGRLLAATLLRLWKENAL